MFNRLKSFIKSLSLPIFYQGGFNIFSSSPKINKDYYYGIVLRCIDVIATNVANNEFGLYQDSKGDTLERLEHPAFKLLQRPNQFFTNHDLFYLTMAHILTGGASYWYLPKNLKNEPAEIWPLPPDRILVEKGSSQFIKSYTFLASNGKRVELTTEDVIPIYRPNPFDWWSGVSLLHAARYEADADLSSIIWNANFFKHGAIPSGSLTVDGFLDKEKADIIRDNLKEMYSGKDNAHKIMVLGKGQSYNQISPKQKDMDFVGQRTFSRDEILAIFNVPKSVIGITDDVNRANAEVADYVFAKRNIKPWLGLIFEKLNTFYLPKFKNTDALFFDFEDPTPNDKVQELEEDKAAVNNWETVNEIRAKRNLEPIKGGDVLYYPLTLYPAMTDQDPSNPQPSDKGFEHILLKKGYSKNERVFLIRKKRVLAQYQKALQAKMTQHIKNLAKDIRQGQLEKVYKTKGSEQIITFLKPLLDNWEVLTADILIEFSQPVAKEAIDLSNEVYNIPKVDMSSLIPLLKKRSQDTADSVSNTIYERAREIIAINLENNVLDPQKIVNEIASTLNEEASYRAERIMRTEIAYTFSTSAFEDFKASGFVEQVKWIVGDAPCPICSENDKEIVKLGQNFKTGHSAPPIHPNCECDVVPVF